MWSRCQCNGRQEAAAGNAQVLRQSLAFPAQLSRYVGIRLGSRYVGIRSGYKYVGIRHGAELEKVVISASVALGESFWEIGNL